MQDPVFIDTADGKALIADSLKENSKNVDVKTNAVKSEDIKHNNTNETLKEKTKDSNVVSVNVDNIQESRGGMYCIVNFIKWNMLTLVLSLTSFINMDEINYIKKKTSSKVSSNHTLIMFYLKKKNI